MGDPVATAALLAEQLAEVMGKLTLAPVRARELEELQGRAATIATELAEFAENYAPLAYEDRQSVLAATELFAALPAGVIDHSSGLSELVAASPLLRKLTGAGLGIVSLRKLSDRERRLAQSLGDDFRDVGELWRQLRGAMRGRGAIAVRTFKEHLPAQRRLASMLSELGLFELADVKAKRFKEQDFVSETELDKHVISRHGPRHPYRLVFTRLGVTEYESMFTGEWLNVYTSMLITKHLTAAGIEHELYTSMTYRNPPEILRGGSDFDVLVEANGIVAEFECKSGELDAADVQKVVDRAKGIERIVRSTAVEADVRHFLLYVGATADSTIVERAAEGSPVRAITPGQVRSAVNTMFNGAPSVVGAPRSSTSDDSSATTERTEPDAAGSSAVPPTSSAREVSEQKASEQKSPTREAVVEEGVGKEASKTSPKKAAAKKAAAKKAASKKAAPKKAVPKKVARRALPPYEPPPVESRRDLRVLAAHLVSSKAFEVAIEDRGPLPLNLSEVTQVLRELAPALIASTWFPSVSLTLAWALVDTPYQLVQPSKTGVELVERSAAMDGAIEDLDDEALLAPATVASVLTRNRLPVGGLAPMTFVRWLVSRGPTLPVGVHELCHACAEHLGVESHVAMRPLRVLEEVGLAAIDDEKVDLTDEFTEPRLAAETLHRRAVEILARYQWPHVPDALEELIGE